MTAVAQFHSTVRNWFEEHFTSETRVQAETWPLIAEDHHVLATAPTGSGSGKTLTAFLWSLNCFASGHWEPGCTRLVYVSPLKALNNDIKRNLTRPIEELACRHALRKISVRTRSGDTAQADRQRMQEILAVLDHICVTQRRIAIDAINDENPRGSAYIPDLERMLRATSDHKTLYFEPR